MRWLAHILIWTFAATALAQMPPRDLRPAPSASTSQLADLLRPHIFQLGRDALAFHYEREESAKHPFDSMAVVSSFTTQKYGLTAGTLMAPSTLGSAGPLTARCAGALPLSAGAPGARSLNAESP